MEEFLYGPGTDEDPPEETRHLWDAFYEISRARAVGVSMGGVVLPPITHEGISEWCRAYGIEFQPWEISTLRMLDDIWLEEQRKIIKTQQKQQQQVKQ